MKFRARTDHKALKWLFSIKEPEGQTARWITKLSEYEFSIEHREDKRHRNADGMSRIPCHQCGYDEKNIATSAVNRQFCYVQNDTTRRQQELVNKNDTSDGSGTACCSSRITYTSSTLRDQSSYNSFKKAQQEQDKDIHVVLSWAEAFPLKNHTAPVIAEILIDQFISRFGAPFQLHSDQGPEFESRLISELC
ncbi:unnamed protein product [Mytilus coruscus]|uniref:Reverse transcriptase RNase H-like domain-containing protein n=1 Tax=Mytilus coruscus TaxID=42192 RepID=A0A6J8BDX9_MYTCO|nr:unnamed protein product [Mytilus coruscus]